MRNGLTSMTITRAPRWRETSAMRQPMGPPPRTTTASPAFTWARVTSWVAMASGSISAAWSSLSESGTLMSRPVGTAQ